MFAFLSIGVQELVILGILGGGGVFVAVLVLFLANRSKGSGARMAELEDENRRLREKLDRER